MLFGSAFASLFEFCVATVCITKEGLKPLFCYAGNNAFGARTCPPAGWRSQPSSFARRLNTAVFASEKRKLRAGGAVPRENTTLWCFLTRGLQVLL